MQLGARDAEFVRLADGVVYADHAGAGLHSDAQAMQAARLANATLVCNPHSSAATSRALDDVAARVLCFFGADPKTYSLIWTSGATAALKLVGENFGWSAESSFAYHSSSHNSVVGIREYARAGGAAVSMFSSPDQVAKMTRGLVAISGQCNFSGRKSDVVALRKSLNSNVLLLVDGASLAASSAVNIDAVGCDFFCVSFYKLFGLPSGLGALIAHTKRTEIAFSSKKYFGGGTVEASSASQTDFVKFRSALSARYHDGTLPFLSILSLQCGFNELNRFSAGAMMSAVESHAFVIAARVARAMSVSRHYNGQPAFEIYGEWGRNTEHVSQSIQGPIVSFNVLCSDGTYLGYSKVESLASLHKIMLRTGCFCNPGACEEFLGLTFERVAENAAAGKVCWDDKDVMNNRPTGAVRLSFGWSSTESDADKVIDFLLACFVERKREMRHVEGEGSGVVLDRICLYPIKSCGSMEVTEWKVGPRGLVYDREWVLVEARSQRVMSQKRYPQMCLLKPVVSLEKRVLCLNNVLEVSLDYSPGESSIVGLCSDFGNVLLFKEDRISDFLRTILGVECFLGRLDTSGNDRVGESGAAIAFANEAQFLVVSQESIDYLNSQYDLKVDYSRFRPNLVISGGMPHFEDDVSRLFIGDNCCEFVAQRLCSRCEMVCIDQTNGEVGTQPLRALGNYRRSNGQVLFGALFSCAATETQLKIGAAVTIKH